MANPVIQDFSFRLDRSENMVINRNYDYMKGIVAYLFGLRPGSDEYNPEMGLDLPGKRFTTGRNNSRDTEYEKEIEHQFAKYTDMIAMNTVAYRKDGRYLISFILAYQNNFYEASVGVNDNTLTIVIDEQNAGIVP